MCGGGELYPGGARGGKYGGGEVEGPHRQGVLGLGEASMEVVR